MEQFWSGNKFTCFYLLVKDSTPSSVPQKYLSFLVDHLSLNVDKKLVSYCYIMTLKTSSKLCHTNENFPFSKKKSIFINYSPDFIFSLFQKMVIHPQKVLTSPQESPGWSLSLCLNGVLGKTNLGCDMFYLFKELLCFFLSFNLLETQKHFAAALSHKDGMQSTETAILFLYNWLP